MKIFGHILIGLAILIALDAVSSIIWGIFIPEAMGYRIAGILLPIAAFLYGLGEHFTETNKQSSK